jgi:hypothetical protein
LWADAICINQADIAERSIQTSKMRTIYQIAESVAVWLGLTYNNAGLAVHFARAPNLCSKDEASQLIRDPENKFDLEMLVTLFRRQYWWRVWVIQEVRQENGSFPRCIRLAKVTHRFQWPERLWSIAALRKFFGLN